MTKPWSSGQEECKYPNIKWKIHYFHPMEEVLDIHFRPSVSRTKVEDFQLAHQQ